MDNVTLFPQKLSLRNTYLHHGRASTREEESRVAVIQRKASRAPCERHSKIVTVEVERPMTRRQSFGARERQSDGKL
jgi:hypothetical protein